MANRFSLKEHLLTHVKEPAQSCFECGGAFKRSDLVIKHMKRRHKESYKEAIDNYSINEKVTFTDKHRKYVFEFSNIDIYEKDNNNNKNYKLKKSIDLINDIF